MEISEAKIQSECYIYFHNNYPELRGLLCYNLNNSKNNIQGSINKSLGLQKGRSDMVFYYKGKAYMLECKTEKGYQSKEQKEWQKVIEMAGFDYYIFRSLNEFKKIIENIKCQ